MMNSCFHARVHRDHHEFFWWFSLHRANSRNMYYNKAYYVKKALDRARTPVGTPAL
jgi:hypothetical protein